MPGWAPWRNLWNLPLGRRIISSQWVPDWMEHLAHQGFILKMDSHSLTEMAHMVHWVRSSIVDGERWLMEMPGKSCSFNPAREGRLGNLVQRFAHSVISQSSVSWALVSVFTMVFLFIWERFTRRSPWSTSITTILLIIRRGVKLEGSSSSLCMA